MISLKKKIQGTVECGGQQMPVHVHCNLYGSMANELLHVAFVRAQGQKNRRKTVPVMPKIVKPEVGQELELLFIFVH